MFQGERRGNYGHYGHEQRANAIGSFICLDKFQKAIKIGKLDVSYEIYEIKVTLKIS